jgi:hypothetical protein
MGSAPRPETYPWKMANGVTFTGSHIHTIDYDREKFATFMGNNESAKSMVKGSASYFIQFITALVRSYQRQAMIRRN